MTDSSPRSRRLLATAGAALALFLAILILLAVQMARGNDPSLGADSRAQKAAVTTTPTQPAEPSVTPAPGSGDGSYDDGAYDQGYGDDQGYAAPQQQAVPQQQQQQQAPLQSSTS